MSGPTAATLHDLLTSRIPPHSLEAERAVLGLLLLEPESVAEVTARLTTTDFYKEAHRKVFAAVLTLTARREAVDLLTVSETLKRHRELDEVGGPAALAGLVEEAATAAHVKSYCDIVRDKAIKRELIRLGTGLVGGGYDDADAQVLLDATTAGLRALETGHEAPSGVLGIGLGTFLGQAFSAPEAYIEGLLSSEGSGWLAGEEKLGKSMYALHEALSLALGVPVLGRYHVPRQLRVLFVEEEDPPRRVWGRVRALLRGFGLDPDDPSTRAELDQWFRVVVWEGVTLDNPQTVARLGATLDAFPAHVVYLDVLRKLTTKDLNKANEAGALLGALDELRRRHGAVFRVLHHYRKAQGFRVGRGSQEIGGSFALGAWGECSLFFEPIGRKQGAVRVQVQTKDGAPVPAFRLTIHAEGPPDVPDLLTLSAEDVAEDTSVDDQLAQAVATLEPSPALVGKAGVSVAALIAALKKSDKGIRRGLKRLEAAGRVAVVGQASRGVVLYGVDGQ